MEFCTANGRLQPGFRFYPTDEELVMYYLKRKVLGKRLEPVVVAEVDIYQFHPEDLRDLACLQKDRNWYFFCPRGKKYGCGDRTNRATNTGYWKATGNDRLVTYGHRTVGKIKTLVFHLGKPPKGDRTDWVMHEFKLEDNKLADLGVSQDSYVLCKIFKKSGWGPKNGEQYGAPFMEEEWDDEDEIPNCEQMLPDDVQNQSISVVTHVMECTNACPAYTSEQVYSGSVPVSDVDQAPPPTSNLAAANVVSSSDVLIPNNSHSTLQQAPTPISVAVDWNSCSMAYSGAVSVSAVDQSPSPTSNVAANLASSSSVLIPNHSHAIIVEAHTPMPVAAAADWTSCSMAYSGAVSVPAGDQSPSPTAAANLASSSKSPPLPYYSPAVNQETAAMPIGYYDPAVLVPSAAMPRAAADIGSTSMEPFPFYDDDEIFTADDLRGIFEGLPDLDNEIVQGNESVWGNIYEEGGLGLTDLDDPCDLSP